MCPPTVPSPSTGRLPTKRARADSDVDETPVKKGKGKGKSNAEEVVESDEDELGVEQSGEEEEMEGGGEEEETAGVWDDEAYDPEGVALGEEEEDEVDVVERVEEEDTGSSVRPVQKQAGQRRAVKPRRPKISLPRSIEAFTAMSIGRAGGLPKRSRAIRKKCLAHFVIRMEKIIRVRSDLAHSDALSGPDFPMTRGTRRWWTTHSQEEILAKVSQATTEERRLVLGGMWLGHYKFTDLPPMTNEELDMWFVYGDLVGDTDMYAGSATADPKKSGAGFRRAAQYERAKRWANDGIVVSREIQESRHLRKGLRQGVEMEFRVLAVFDPFRVHVSLPLAVDGIYIDFLQSFDRNWEFRPDRPQVSPDCLQCSIDASENDARWTELRKLKTKQPKLTAILAQDKVCVVCEVEAWDGTIQDVGKADQFLSDWHEDFPGGGQPIACGSCVAWRNKNRKHAKYLDRLAQQRRNARQ